MNLFQKVEISWMSQVEYGHEEVVGAANPGNCLGVDSSNEALTW